MSENFQNYEENLIETETKGAEENFAPLGEFIPPFSPEEISYNNEKRELSKRANIAGVSLFLIGVFALLLNFLIQIAIFLTGNSSTLSSILNEPAIAQVYQIVFSLGVFTLPFIICYKIGKCRIGEFISFNRADKNLELALFFLGTVFCFFTNMASAYIDSIFSTIGIDYSIGKPDAPDGFFGFLLYTLSMAVVPAVVEEFALRGLVLGSLRRFGNTFAIVASALCFGIMHGNFDQIPFAFTVGLFLGYTVIKTDSLKVAIFVHFFNNFISVAFSYLQKGGLVNYQNIIYLALLSICFLLALFFIKRLGGQENLKIDEKDSILKEKKKYKIFFFSIGIIVFVFVNFVQAISLLFN